MHKPAQILDSAGVKQAAFGAVKKMSLVSMAGNPVMFVVMVGALLAALITGQKFFNGETVGFELTTTLILLLTVWFSNFAESVAEARGRGPVSYTHLTLPTKA